MTKNKKTILYIILALALTGALVAGSYTYYAFVYMQNHRTTPADLEPEITLNAEELLKQVEADWAKAGKTSAIPSFIGEKGAKIIQTNGKIASKTMEESGNVTINLLGEAVGINCQLDSASAVTNKTLIEKYKVGDEVIIKGKCTGFDYDEESFEMLGEENKHVKLSECVIIEQ
ncbi:MAG: hypothetical protein AUK44_10485 [Porphyromonadaceae bacterium CG2_30_38_12]|nr:MAG: hypothetical protein AUK44_10485 [Porphyromonadaceae bacterium CG2_30_38_12]